MEPQLKKQPDPQPPEFIPANPSLTLYLVLGLFALLLIIGAFIFELDWSGLALNLGTEIIGAILILIIVDQRVRSEDVRNLQGYMKTTANVLDKAHPRYWFIPRSLLSYADIFKTQLKEIEPKNYFSRPEFENLIYKHPKGYILVGSSGSGKSVLLQRIALNLINDFKSKPRQSPIPILIPLRLWGRDKLVDHLYDVMASYYPTKRRIFDHWLKAGRIIVICDGLDELYETDNAKRSIEELCSDYPKTSIIISSRPLEANICNLPKVALTSLTQSEVTRFLKQAGVSISLPENVEAFQGNPLLLSLLLDQVKRIEDRDELAKFGSNPAEAIMNRQVENFLVKFSHKLDGKFTVEEIRGCFTQIANIMNQTNTLSISPDAVDSRHLPIIKLALEHDFLIYETDGGYSFQHRVMKDWFSNEEDKDS